MNSFQHLIEKNKHIRGYDSTGLPWEQKAVAVIKCIEKLSQKVEGTVLLAAHCQMPWSRVVQSLVDSISQIDHPR